MGMNEVISIKYGILFLGEKSFIRGIKFEIYWASNSIPAAKSQNFVNISWGQKPTCSKFLEFDFFYLKTFFSGEGGCRGEEHYLAFALLLQIDFSSF